MLDTILILRLVSSILQWTWGYAKAGRTVHSGFFHQGGYMRRLIYRIGLPALISCLLVSMFALSAFQVPRAHAAGEVVSIWLTTPDQAHLLAQQGSLNFSGTIGSNSTTITVNDGTTYQQM